MGSLQLPIRLPLRAHNGGLFVSPGSGTHPDRVIDSYELIFVRRGTLSLLEHTQRFDVPADHTLLLWPGRRHRGAEPYSRQLSFYWVHFSVSESRRATERMRIPQLGHVARPDRLAELFHRYLDDQDAGRLGLADGPLLLLLMLFEAGRQPLPTGDSGNVLAARAETFIASHLAENLSASSLARALRVNPDYLNRVFRRTHQQTLTEYIHRRRIREARLLLRDGTQTITEVAACCGFADAAYFRRLFRRYEGLSPGAFRRLYARTHVISR